MPRTYKIKTAIRPLLKQSYLPALKNELYLRDKCGYCSIYLSDSDHSDIIKPDTLLLLNKAQGIYYPYEFSQFLSKIGKIIDGIYQGDGIELFRTIASVYQPMSYIQLIGYLCEYYLNMAYQTIGNSEKVLALLFTFLEKINDQVPPNVSNVHDAYHLLSNYLNTKYQRHPIYLVSSLMCLMNMRIMLESSLYIKPRTFQYKYFLDIHPDEFWMVKSEELITDFHIHQTQYDWQSIPEFEKNTELDRVLDVMRQ